MRLGATMSLCSTRATSTARSRAPSSTSAPSSRRTSPPSSGSTEASQSGFLRLVESYLAQAVVEGQAAAGPLLAFEEALSKLINLAEPFATEARDPDPMGETWEELTSTQDALSADFDTFAAEVAARVAEWDKTEKVATRENGALHAAREGLHDMAERCRDLTKQVDLSAKLAGRAVDIAVSQLDARDSDHWAHTDINRARRALEDARAAGVEALRRARYFVIQADWLQERFPKAELRDIEGLVKLVTRTEIAASAWSLTPGRFVGVAPEAEDEDFNFEDALRSIHIDLKDLNKEAEELAARLARNFEELAV